MENQKKITGRPREHNIESFADKLVEWAAKEDSTNLNAFCFENKIPPQNITFWANKNETFCEAYNIAKTAIAVRREKKLSDGSLHQKAYDLNATVYDYFLRQEKRDQIKYETECKKEEIDSQLIKDGLYLLKQSSQAFISAQSDSNNAKNSSNNDSKSECETGDSLAP